MLWMVSNGGVPVARANGLSVMCEPISRPDPSRSAWSTMRFSVGTLERLPYVVK